MTISHIACGTATGTVIASTVNSLIDNTGVLGRTATVTLFGDSYSVYEKFSDAGNNYQDSVIQASCWSFLLANLGSAVNVTEYAGVGGDRASDMLTRITDDVLVPTSGNGATDWVFGQVGVNDFYPYSRTAAAVVSDVQSMITSIIANGQKVLWLNCPPQNSSRGDFSSAKSVISADYNRIMAAWAQDIDGLVWVDVYSTAVAQNDAANGAARTSYAIGTDKIHLSMYGAWETGRLCEIALAPYMVQTSNTKEMSPVNAGDYGDLNFSNFNGTGGTAGTAASGDIPTGWVVKRNSGEGTIVGSHNAAGYYEMAIAKAVAGTSSVYRVQSNDLKANFSGGENVESRLILSIDDVLDVEEIRAYFYNDNSSDPYYTIEWGRSINGYTPINPMPVGDIVIHIGPAVILDTPLTNVYYYLDLRMKGTGTATVTLKHLRITDV